MRDIIHVNLLPIEYRIVKRDFSFLFDSRVLLGALMAVVTVISFVAGREFISSNLAAKQLSINEVDAEIAKNAYVAIKIKQLEAVRDEKNAKNISLRSISVSKRKWVRILEGLSKSMPLNTWLDVVKQNETTEQEMEILGRTFVFPEVAEYMLELEKNEYFQKVSLNSIEFQKEGDKSYFNFKIKIDLNPSAGMESFISDPTPGKVL